MDILNENWFVGVAMLQKKRLIRSGRPYGMKIYADGREHILAILRKADSTQPQFISLIWSFAALICLNMSKIDRLW